MKQARHKSRKEVKATSTYVKHKKKKSSKRPPTKNAKTIITSPKDQEGKTFSKLQPKTHALLIFKTPSHSTITLKVDTLFRTKGGLNVGCNYGLDLT